MEKKIVQKITDLKNAFEDNIIQTSKNISSTEDTILNALGLDRIRMYNYSASLDQKKKIFKKTIDTILELNKIQDKFLESVS